ASIRAFNERAAINARLQGTAADIIRRAMVRMEAALAKAKLSAQMLLQVHDELVFEVPEAEVAKTLPVVEKVMAQAPMPALSLSGPLAVRGPRRDQWGRGALSQTARPPSSSAKADDPVMAELDQRHFPGVDRTSTGYWMLAVAGMTISMIAILAPSPAQAAA